MPSAMNVARYISSAIMGFLCALPYIGIAVDTFTRAMVDVLRLVCGSHCASNLSECKRPKELLKLYEFEACPYCRKVREVLTMLDIDHIVYPCPRETLRSAGQVINSRYRPVVAREGGRIQFPFLIDPNTNTKLYESDEIIKYLWDTYGKEAKPTTLYRIANHPSYQMFSMKCISLFRPRGEHGMLRAVSTAPKKLLEVWGYETSTCTRLVREKLACLELPYIYHVIPYGSAKREAFLQKYSSKLCGWRKRCGFIQVPLLVDPNTGVEMFESHDIVAYLKRQYETAPVMNCSWLEYGMNEKKSA